MRTLLFLCLAACSTSLSIPGGATTLALPRALIEELRFESVRRGVPVSTLLADAWGFYGPALRYDLSHGERPKPDYSRADRQPLTCWFDAVVLADLQRTAGETGVDLGALLTTAWRLYVPRPSGAIASR